MIPVIILSRSLLECRVLVEIARMKAAKKKNGKKALDQPSSYCINVLTIKMIN